MLHPRQNGAEGELRLPEQIQQSLFLQQGKDMLFQVPEGFPVELQRLQGCGGVRSFPDARSVVYRLRKVPV